MSDVKHRPIKHAADGDDWVVVQGESSGLGEERRVKIARIAARNPRIVRNKAPVTSRFPACTPLVTGVATATRAANENGVYNGKLLVESGSGGRAFYSSTYTIEADTWYAISFDVTQLSGMTSGSNCGFYLQTTGTAVIDNSTGDITETKLAAGGIGRYGVVFRSILGGTLIFRLGVGLSSNIAGKSLEFENFQYEILTPDSAGMPGNYVYPGYSAAFDTPNPYTMDANGKLTPHAGQPFALRRFSRLLVVGDSRNNEVDETGYLLNQSMGSAGIGVCDVHAEGGWTTTHILGPASFSGANMTNDVSVDLASVLDGGARVFTWSTDGDEQIADLQGIPYDTLFICNLGVNNINGDNATGLSTAIADIVTMCDMADQRGMDVIIGDNNPCKGGAGISDTEAAQVVQLNQALQALAASRGYPYVGVYSRLSDSTNKDKLSDGGGTTPDYSTDLLHLNAAGHAVYAAEALAVVQANR